MTNPDHLVDQCRRQLLDARVGPRLLVAFSGGLDSSVLVDILDRLHRRGGPSIELMHVDHRLRKTSRNDARFCRDEANRRGITITVERLDFEGASASQAEARRRRMAAIATRAIARGIDDVVFAHHGDDRIESFLFHLRRGTGLDGLAPMKPVDTFPFVDTELRIVRPLLQQTRRDLEEYARRRDVAHVTDPTNRTDTYARNRIRHHLVEELAETPEMRRRILDAITNLEQERRAADQWVDRLVDRARVPTPGVRTHGFDRTLLADAPAATTARLFRRLQPSLDSDSLHAIRDAITHPARSRPLRLTLSGCVITVVRNRVVFEPSEARGGRDVLDRTARPIRLRPFAGGTAPFVGCQVHWQLQPAGPSDIEDRWVAEFDAAEFVQPLQIAGFQAGAELLRCRRDGSVYHQKLTKLFSQHRVDADVRWRWPCLYDADGRLVWAAGLERGCCAEPGDGEDRIWRLEVRAAPDLAVILQP